MNTVSVSLGTLIDRTLLEIQAPKEQGRRVVLASDLLVGSTSCVLVDSTSVNPSDLIEFNSELVMVTGRTQDVTPTLTVARRYASSTTADHEAGTVGFINPSFPRVRVAEAIRRSLARMEALGLPAVATDTFTLTTDRMVPLPDATRDVIRVGTVDRRGQWSEVGGWQFWNEAPKSRYPSGKVLSVPRRAGEGDELDVTYRRAYRWSSWPEPPDESSTIELLEGAEDLPSNYAAAWLIGAREVSRVQLDNAEEWNVGEPVRNGVSLSLLKAKWQDFYRALDEARRLSPVPVHRTYRRMIRP